MMTSQTEKATSLVLGMAFVVCLAYGATLLAAAPAASPAPQPASAPSAANPHPLTGLLLEKGATPLPIVIPTAPAASAPVRSASAPIRSASAPTSPTLASRPTLHGAAPSTSTLPLRLAGRTPPAPSPPPTSAPRVDVNQATAEEIAAATGVDLVRAQNIVDFRRTIGPFKELNDLKEVQGITDSVFARILPHIMVTPPAPTPRPAPR